MIVIFVIVYVQIDQFVPFSHTGSSISFSLNLTMSHLPVKHAAFQAPKAAGQAEDRIYQHSVWTFWSKRYAA